MRKSYKLQDEKKQWWSSFFGQDGIPWKEKPGILPVTIETDNIIRVETKK